MPTASFFSSGERAGLEKSARSPTAPILLLAEVPPDTITAALQNSLTLTIGSLEGAIAAVTSAEALGGRHRVHVKVDTGMHRMGVAPEDVDVVVDILNESESIDLEGIYTHFSVADGSSAEDRAFTREQIEHFDDVVAELAQRGIVPLFSVWLPHHRPVRGSTTPPALDYYRRARQGFADLFAKYKLEPPGARA